MYLFCISLLLYSVLIVYKTSQSLEVSYNNKKFNEEYGLEYIEDIDDLTTVHNRYSLLHNLN